MSKVGQMSRDRVRFFLHYRYYGSEMCDVMQRAFGIDVATFQELRGANEGGFWVLCRPSQFARFMIYRDGAGVVNGFKDLNAVLIKQEQKITIAEHIARLYPGLTNPLVAQVLDAVGMDPNDIVYQPHIFDYDQVEVWSNSHSG